VISVHAPGVNSRIRLDLLRVLVSRQLKLRAKRSAIGVAWPVLSPFVLFALYLFVFHGVFRVPGVDRYPEFLFAGLLPWTFLTQSLGLAVTSVSTEPELVRRARFPYELLPIATTTAMLSYFLVTLTAFLVYLGVTGGLHVAILPVVVLPLMALYLFVTGLALVLAWIDVHNRDLRMVLQNILTVWFFLVPIVYRQDMVTKRLLFLRSIDPANLVVGQFRAVLYYGRIVNRSHIVLMLLICVAFFTLCLALFRRLSVDLAKDV
jgi:lipopolysaccharide transport system permease protein